MSRPGPRSCPTPRRRAATVACLLLACVAATLAAGWAQPAYADTAATESVIANRLADARAAAGVPALRRSGDLDAVARAWSRRQAEDRAMSHNPALADQVQPARAWYENVGYLTGVPDHRSYQAAGERLHELWMGSSGHRANILRTPLTDVGIGVAVAGDELYATVVFRARDGAASDAAHAPTPSPEPAPAPAPAPEPTAEPSPEVTANSAPSSPTPAPAPEPSPAPDVTTEPEPATEPAPEPSPAPTGPPAWIADELERHSGAGPVAAPTERSGPLPPEGLAVPGPTAAVPIPPATATTLHVRDETVPPLPVLIGMLTVAGAATMGARGRWRRTR